MDDDGRSSGSLLLAASSRGLPLRSSGLSTPSPPASLSCSPIPT
jgi:hypothetical protein